jgi:hypothetical protein
LSTGGGHGNFYILLPIIPWLLLFVALFQLGKLNDLVKRITFVLVMAIHYGIIIILLAGYDFAADKGWTKHNLPYLPLVWYLIGQIIIWRMFAVEVKKIKGEEVG